MPLVKANWIGVKKLDEDRFLVRNFLYEEDWELNREEYEFLQQLDGEFDPVQYAQEGNSHVLEYLENFEEAGLVRDKWVAFHQGPFTKYRTVHIFKNHKVKGWLKIVMNALNQLIMVAAAFSFLAFWGIVPFLRVPLYHLLGEVDYVWWIAGIVVGIILHEAGHAIATFAYGGRVFECGVYGGFGVLLGAYVLIDTKNVRKRGRIQVNLAGMEMNMILVAVFMVLTLRHPGMFSCFMAVVVSNLFLLIPNLFLPGTDGIHVLGDIFDDEYFESTSKWSVVKFYDEWFWMSSGIASVWRKILYFIFGLIQISGFLATGMMILYSLYVLVYSIVEWIF